MTTGGKLKGGVALVTGGGGAIGGASSRLLAAEGAAVLVVDTDIALAETVAADIRDAGGAAQAYQADVSGPVRGFCRRCRCNVRRPVGSGQCRGGGHARCAGR